MTATLRPDWDGRLQQWAEEGRVADPTRGQAQAAEADPLNHAYALCETLSAVHSKSFHLASSLLPGAKRRAVRTLYTVCRISDDLVDQQQGEAALAAWHARVLAPEAAPTDPVLRAWADTRQRYAIPQRYVEQLLDGLAQDLQPRPLATFDDLAQYAYGVASTVGLMCMHIIGYTSEAARPYAVKLGVALQVTNILRDVGEDGRAGRTYLPLAELAQFGLGLTDLAAGAVDDRWRAFMQFQIQRNRRLYAEAWPGIELLAADGRLAIAAAAELYSAILTDIEAHDYDVFHRRAHLNAMNKLSLLPGIWRRNHRRWLPTTL